MLTLKNLSKKFGQVVALSDLSLKIDKGEIYALIGPNGAGKTTTIKIVAGLYLADGGTIEFAEKRRAIGYIPDEPVFYPGLTGLEFLNFVAAIYGAKNEQKDAVIAKFAKIFPFREILNENPENYSRGNKQKLAICAAFLIDPKLLLVDEPIVGLDPQSAGETLKLFSNFAKEGGSIFVSTHTLLLAEQIAHRVGIIREGKLIAEGTLATLRKTAKLKDAHLEEIFLKLTQEEEE